MSDHVSRLQVAENEFHQNLPLARALAFEVYQSNPQNLKALEILCLAALKQGDNDSFARFLKAATIAPTHTSLMLYEFGSSLLAAGKEAESIPYLQSALEKASDSFPILHDFGVALAATGKINEGLVYLEKAASLEQTSHELFYNIGRIYDANYDFQRSLKFYEKSLAIKPDFIPALINKGVALYELKDFNLALSSYEEVLRFSPNIWEVWLNIGNLLQQIDQPTNALIAYERALLLNPKNPEALASKSDIYHKQRQYQDAITCMEEALNTNPAFPYLAGALFHSKMCICDWENFQSRKSNLCTAALKGEKVSPPFPLLAITDDENVHLKAAQTWALDKLSPQLPALKPHPWKKKIRLGYYSADFHHHATMLLMLDIFKHHNSEEFQVYAFSYGPSTEDVIQKDIDSLVYEFINVQNMADEKIVELSRRLQIDIAIDLKGYTESTRSHIFSKRLAPLQINFLGYPGTSGADCFDYIIADIEIIPRSNQKFYSEKIIYLPGSYQINSNTRKFSSHNFLRSDFHLPADTFIFCCFNHNYKITPEIFSSWVEILSKVDNSILWLLEDNEIASHNLKLEIAKLGLNENRLRFAKRLPLDEHLSRHQLADLFLDTAPCNAHTTASDALWSGLPVLTYAGKSFASRVSSSLLQALNLPELICTDIASYKQKAIQLASNPSEMKNIRTKLRANITTSSLFDSRKFTRHLEAALRHAYQLNQNGQIPCHIYPEDYLSK